MAKAFLDGSWMSCLQDNPLYGRTIEVLPNSTIAQQQQPRPAQNQGYTSAFVSPLIRPDTRCAAATDSNLSASVAGMTIGPQPSTYANFPSTQHEPHTYMNFARAIPARPEPEYVSTFGPACKLLPGCEEENDANVESVYDVPRCAPAATAHQITQFELAEMRRIEEMNREWQRRCACKMIELSTDINLDATPEEDLLDLIAHATASLQRRHRSVPGYQA